MKKILLLAILLLLTSCHKFVRFAGSTERILRHRMFEDYSSKKTTFGPLKNILLRVDKIVYRGIDDSHYCGINGIWHNYDLKVGMRVAVCKGIACLSTSYEEKNAKFELSVIELGHTFDYELLINLLKAYYPNFAGNFKVHNYYNDAQLAGCYLIEPTTKYSIENYILVYFDNKVIRIRQIEDDLNSKVDWLDSFVFSPLANGIIVGTPHNYIAFSRTQHD